MLCWVIENKLTLKCVYAISAIVTHSNTFGYNSPKETITILVKWAKNTVYEWISLTILVCPIVYQIHPYLKLFEADDTQILQHITVMQQLVPKWFQGHNKFPCYNPGRTCSPSYSCIPSLLLSVYKYRYTHIFLHTHCYTVCYNQVVNRK